MNFDKILSDIISSALGTMTEGSKEIAEYLKQIFENEKNSLEELALAKSLNQISDDEFLRELEREKIVLETEMLTIKVMTKAEIQKAINAAIDTLVGSLKIVL